MLLLFYAATMGFILAAPFGAIGAATALAAMQHRLPAALLLAAGVMVADAVVIIAVNAALLFFPQLVWAEVQSWGGLWWPIIVGLTGYGVYMLAAKPSAITQAALQPAKPLQWAIFWTLFANPKNWLGTFAAYMGWQVAGLLPTMASHVQVGVAAWLGGLVSWALWIALCWQAKCWQVQAERVAQRLIGVLCLIAAATAAWLLLAP